MIEKASNGSENDIEKQMKEHWKESVPDFFKAQNVPSRKKGAKTNSSKYMSQYYGVDFDANKNPYKCDHFEDGIPLDRSKPSMPEFAISQLQSQTVSNADLENLSAKLEMAKEMVVEKVGDGDMGNQGSQIMREKSAFVLNIPAATIKVYTVDSFQGQEDDIVILTLAVTEECSDFASNRHRLNVALTRARLMMLVLVNASSIDKESSETEPSLWKKLLEDARSRTLFTSSTAILT